MKTEYIKEEVKAGLQATVATVVFEKVDGTLRQMRCTLMAEHLPKLPEDGKHTPRKEQDETLAVWDLEVGGWRSFRLDSIKSIVYGE